MENNIENKTRFFGAHIGCDVVFTGSGKAIKSLAKRITLNYENIDKLQQIVFSNQRALKLKPLSSITDEDAIELLRLKNYKSFSITEITKENSHVILDFKFVSDKINNADGFSYSGTSCNYENLTSDEADFLRSKGYALKFNGLSVEKQIEYGWTVVSE